MKILYISRGYSPHDHRFLSAIAEAGHDAYYLRAGTTSSETRPLPNKVHALAGSLRVVMDQVKPDLVHAGPLPGPAYQAARSDFRPLVVMSWGSDILWHARRNLLTRRRTSIALGHADAVIGDCDAVRQAAIRFGVCENRIVTFAWGVDLNKFSPQGGDDGLRTLLGWQKNFILLHVRSWEPLYDPLTVAKAFVQAAQENASLRLLMPGSGSLATKIRDVFKQNNMLDRVYLPGAISQDELPAYYRAANLYVSASLCDGSSVSLMEAMACGQPSLVSDIPGNCEWVRSGKEGWLFAIRDNHRLAALIAEAAENKTLVEMGALARKAAEERADWSRNKQGLFKAYDLALENSQ